MGERKVLNKYYPPDFDPSKVPRVRKNKDELKRIKVRMMLPFSLQCGKCGNFIYKGTKFNSRKEDVQDESYLGIRIYRFYFRCPRCSNEITMKTDPKNSDYVCETGATRNFEPRKEEEKQNEEVRKKREEEEEGNAMKALENRALDSKREMDILNALDEIKSLNNRNARMGADQVIAALRSSTGAEGGEAAAREVDEEELEELELRQFRSRNQIKRIDDTADKSGGAAPAAPAAPNVSRAQGKKRNLGVSFAVKPKGAAKVMKKAAEPEDPPPSSEAAGSESKATGLLGLGAYGSSDEDSD